MLGTFLLVLDPARIDALVDLAYGVLILVAIVLIATLEFAIGFAFAVGVFASYVVHVVWKMARFDPEWMTRRIEETIEDTVEAQIEETVSDELEDVQSSLATVDHRLDRTLQSEDVKAAILEALEEETEESSRDRSRHP